MTSKHFLHQTYIFASPPIPISSNILALGDHRQNSCFQLRLSSFLPLEQHHLPHFMKIRKAQKSRAHSWRDAALTKAHVWGKAKEWRNTFSGGLEAHISSRNSKSISATLYLKKCSFYSQINWLFWLSGKGNPESDMQILPLAGFFLYWCPGDRLYFKLVSCIS